MRRPLCPAGWWTWRRSVPPRPPREDEREGRDGSLVAAVPPLPRRRGAAGRGPTPAGAGAEGGGADGLHLHGQRGGEAAFPPTGRPARPTRDPPPAVP